MTAESIPARLSRAVNRRVYYGWIVVGCCFVGAMVTFAIVYSFSVFFGHISATFEQSQANTSLIFSLQSIVTYGSATVLGLFVDRYGARRLLVLATALVAAGLVGASQLQTFVAVVLAYGVVAASGFSLLYVITYATPPRWFDRRRGTATALATAGGGVGILLGPPVASFLIDLTGWQNAYLLITAGTVVVLLVVALLFADRPADIGLDAAAKQEFPDGQSSAGESREWHTQLAAITDIARTPAFLLVFVAYFCIGVPIFFLAAHAVEFSVSIGLGEGVGVLAISIIGGMNVFGKFVAGPISDQIGISRTLAGCGTLLGVALVLLGLVETRQAVLGLVFVFGLGYGGAIGLLSPALAELFGTDDINALFGMTSASFAVTGSRVPFLAGAGYDLTGSYTLPLVVGGVVCLAGVPLIEFAHRRQGGD